MDSSKSSKVEKAKLRAQERAKKIKKSGFLKEFKEFISQGSVMDLAIGVVIGTAFSAIVTSLVNDIIMPLVSLIGGGTDFAKLSITIPNFFGEDTAAVIQYGNFIQNVVNFLLIAISLFLVIRGLNRINRRAKAAAERAEKRLGIEREDEKDEADEQNKDSDSGDKLAKDIKTANDEQTKLLKEILKELKKSNKSK